MKVFTFLLFALLPLYSLGQKIVLKKGEISLSLEPGKMNDGLAAFEFNIMSTTGIEDSLFRYIVGAKGDTGAEYIEGTRKEKMYLSYLMPHSDNRPRYIAVYMAHKGKRIKLAEWNISYKNGMYVVAGKQVVVYKVE